MNHTLADHKKELVVLESQQYIEENNITLEDVEFSGIGVYFPTVSDFITSLEINSTKLYAEWNDRLYEAEGLKERKWVEVPCRIEDIKPKEVNK